MQTTFPVANLGYLGQETQEIPAESEVVPIDLSFAKTAFETVIFMRDLPASQPEVQRLACWRETMVKERSLVEGLRASLQGFIQSEEESFDLPAAQYETLEKVLDCAETITGAETEATELRIGRVATFIGIAGGLAALLAF